MIDGSSSTIRMRTVEGFVRRFRTMRKTVAETLTVVID
jgi:hypothetical protein